MTNAGKKSTAGLIVRAIKAQERENKRRGKHKVLALEYFVAGLPPLPFFELNVEELQKVLGRQEPKPSGPDQSVELCFIGLAAYFEAFWKDLFAAVVNICPSLLEAFALRRDCAFTLAEVLHLADGSKHRIGSLLSEHYDWGSAQAVNGLFLDLIKISPFSKDEAKLYADFLADRNLLVHHGGVYTFKYCGQNFSGPEVKKLAHWQSLAVSRRHVSEWINFALGIARKTSAATHKALESYLQTGHVKLDKERRRAAKFLAPD
jgi:hypothetical protein